jgi:hypothetical protein
MSATERTIVPETLLEQVARLRDQNSELLSCLKRLAGEIECITGQTDSGRLDMIERYFRSNQLHSECMDAIKRAEAKG